MATLHGAAPREFCRRKFLEGERRVSVVPIRRGPEGPNRTRGVARGQAAPSLAGRVDGAQYSGRPILRSSSDQTTLSDRSRQDSPTQAAGRILTSRRGLPSDAAAQATFRRWPCACPACPESSTSSSLSSQSEGLRSQTDGRSRRDPASRRIGTGRSLASHRSLLFGQRSLVTGHWSQKNEGGKTTPPSKFRRL